MNMSEMAKQLAGQKREVSLSSPVQCRLDGVDLETWRNQFSQSITQAMTHEMASLSEALHIQYQEVRALNQRAQASTERLKSEGEAVQGALKAGITAMKEAVEDVRRKQILSTLILGVLIGATSGYAFLSWQQIRSGDKVSAERWKNLQSKMSQISPAARAMIRELAQDN